MKTKLVTMKSRQEGNVGAVCPTCGHRFDTEAESLDHQAYMQGDCAPQPGDDDFQEKGDGDASH